MVNIIPIVLSVLCLINTNVIASENQTNEENEEKIPFLRENILAILDHLNTGPVKVYHYSEATLISAQKKANIIEIVLDVNVECKHEYPGLLCDDGVQTCTAFVRQFSVNRAVLGTVTCVPKKSADIQSTGVPEIDISTVDSTQEEPQGKQTVALSNEAVSSENAGEQHFVAFRREFQPCLGCLLELDPQATGVDELVNLGLNHIESEQKTKHRAVKILRLQQQVVAGVKYIILMEVVPTECPRSVLKTREECEFDPKTSKICQIEFVQKPWISHTKHIINNNCTKSQEYFEADTNNRDKYPYDIDNEIETSDEIKNKSPKKSGFFEPAPNFDRIAESGTIYDDSILPSRLADLESQILFGEPIPQPTPMIKKQDSSKILVEHMKPTMQSEPIPESISSISVDESEVVDDRPSNSVNTEVVSNGEASPSPMFHIPISEEVEQTPSEWTSLPTETVYSPVAESRFENLDDGSVSTTTEPELVKITAYLGQIEFRPKRAIRQLEKISHEEKGLVKDLADYAANFLDNIDDDDHKRIVLQILGAKKLGADDGVYYHLILRLGISQCLEVGPLNPEENCREKLLENYTKICKVQVYVSDEFNSPKVIKSQCQNIKRDKNDSNRTNYSRYRRSSHSVIENELKQYTHKTKRQLVGAPIEVIPNDPIVLDYVYQGLNKLDSEGSHENKLKVLEILSATKQVVSGVLYKITAKIIESDCKKTSPTDPKLCGVKGEANSPVCNFKVWDQPWLPDGRKIDISCENSDKQYSFRARRSVKGGIKSVSPDSSEILDLAYQSLEKLDSESSSEHKQKIHTVLSASQQTVAGSLYRIEAKIIESDCKKTDSKHSKLCGVREGADPRICNFQIWDRPWLPNGREINITCENEAKQYSYKVKRDTVAGGVTEISVDSPEVLELTSQGLEKIDSDSSDGNKLKVQQILSSTKQVVSGTLYKIKAKIIESDCKKSDPKESKLCGEKEGAESRTCNFEIWDQPWLPNGRKIDISCEKSEKQYSFRARRSSSELSVKGGIKNVSPDSSEILDLAYQSLEKLDSESSSEHKQKIHTVLSASQQTVAGSLYRIEAKIIESDCKKTDSKHSKLCGVREGADPRICNFQIWDRPWLPNGREINITCENEAKQYSYKVKRDTVAGGVTEISVDSPEVLELTSQGLEKIDSDSSDGNKLKVQQILSSTKQVVSGTLYKIKAKIIESDCKKSDPKESKLCGEKEGAESRTCNFEIWDQPWLPNGRKIDISCENTEKQYSFRARRSSSELSVKGGIKNVSPDSSEILDLAYQSLEKLDSESSSEHKQKIHTVLSASQQTVAGSLYRIEAKIIESDCKKTDSKHSKLCGVRDGADPRICNFQIWDRPWLPNGREINITCENEAKQYSYKVKRSIPGGVTEIANDSPIVLELTYQGLDKLDSGSSNDNKLKVQEVLSATQQVVSGISYKIQANIIESDCKKSDPKEPKLCGEKDGAESRTCNFEIWDQPKPNGRKIDISCENDENKYSFKVKRQVPGGVTEIANDSPIVLELTYQGLDKLDSGSSDGNKLKVQEVLSATQQVVSGSLYNIKAKVIESDCKKSAPKHPKLCGEKAGAESRTCNFEIWDQPWLPNGRKINITCENDENKYNFRVKRQVLGGVTEIAKDSPIVLELTYQGLDKLDSGSSNNNKLKVQEVLSATQQVVSGISYKIQAKIIESDCKKSDPKEPKLCGEKDGAESRTCNFEIWDQPKPNGRKIDISCENDENKYSFKVKRQVPGGVTEIANDSPIVLELTYQGLDKLDSDSSNDNKLKVQEVLSATQQVVSGISYKIQAKIIESDCKKSDPKVPKLCGEKDGAESRTCNFEIWDQPKPNGRKIDISCENDENKYSFKVKRQVPGGVTEIANDSPIVLELTYQGLDKLDSGSSDGNKLKVQQILSATEQVVSGSLYNIKAKVIESDCKKSDPKHPKLCGDKEGAESRTCNFEIWDQPWIPNGRKINITCENDENKYNFRVKRQVLGGVTEIAKDSPIVLELTYQGLDKLDSGSSNDNKLKVQEVLSATQQVVSGISYKIQAKIIESDCKKSDPKEPKLCGEKDGAESRTCHFEIWDQPKPNGRKIDISCENDENKYSFKVKRQVPGGVTEIANDSPIVLELTYQGLDKLDSGSSNDNKLKVQEVLSAIQQVVSGSLYNIKAKVIESDCKKSDPKHPKLCGEKAGAESRTCNFEVWDQPWLPNGRKINITCENDENKYSFRVKRQVPGGVTAIANDSPILLVLTYEGLDKLDSGSSNGNKLKVQEILSATQQVVSGILYKLQAKIIESDCKKSDPKDPKLCGEKDGAESRTCNFEIWDQPNPDGRKIDISCEGDAQKYSFNVKRSIPGGLTDIQADSPKALELTYQGLEKLDSETSNGNKLKVQQILSATEQVVSGSFYNIIAKVIESDCQKSDPKHPKLCGEKEGAESRTCTLVIWDQPWLPNGRKINITCENDENKYSFKVKRQVPGGVTEISSDSAIVLELTYQGLDKLDSGSSNDNKLKVQEVLSATQQVVSGSLYNIKAKVIESDCKKSDPKHPKLCGEKAGAESRTCNFEIWDQPWLPNGRKINITCENDENKYNFRVKRQLLGGVTKIANDSPIVLELTYQGLDKVDSGSSNGNKLKVQQILSATEQVVSGSLYNIKAKVIESDCQKSDPKHPKLCGEKEGAESRTCNFEIWDQPWIPNGRKINITCENDENKYNFRVKRQVLGGVTEIAKDSPIVLELTYQGLDKLDSGSSNDNKLKVQEVLSATQQVVSGSSYKIKAKVIESDCKKSDPKHPKLCGDKEGAEPRTCNFDIWDQPWLPNGRKINITCENEENKYSFRVKRQVLGGVTEITNDSPIVLQLTYQGLDKIDSESSNGNKLKVQEVISATYQVVSGSSYNITAKVIESDCKKSDPKHPKLCGDKEGAESKTCNFEIWDQPWVPKGRIMNISCENDENKYNFKVKRQVPGGVTEIANDSPIVLELTYQGLDKLDSGSSNDNKLRVQEVLSATQQVVSGSLYNIKAKVIESDCKKSDPKHPKLCGDKEGAESRTCHFEIWDQPWLPNGRKINITCENDENKYNFRVKRQLLGGVTEIAKDSPIVLELTYQGLDKLDSGSSNDNKLRVQEVLSATQQVVSGISYKIQAKIIESDCKKSDPKEPKLCGEKDGAESRTCNFEIWDQPKPNGRKIDISCENDENKYNFKVKRQVPGGVTEIANDSPIVLELTYQGLDKLDSGSSNDNKLKVQEVLSATQQVVSGSLYNIKAKVIESDCKKSDPKHPKLCGEKAGAESRTCNFEIWDQPWLPNGRKINITCENDENKYSFRVKRQVPGGVSEISTDSPIVLELTYQGLDKLDSESSNDNKLKVQQVLSAIQQVVSGSLYNIKAKIIESDCQKSDPKHPSLCGEKEGAESRTCNFEIWDQLWVPNGRKININCENDENKHSFKVKRQIPGGVSEISTDSPIVLELTYQGLAKLDSESSNGNKLKVLKVLLATQQVVSGMLYKIQAKIIESDCKKSDPRHPMLCGVKRGAQPRTCNFEILDQPWLPNGRQININCANDPNKHSFRVKRQVVGGVTKIANDSPIVLDLTYQSLRKIDSESSDGNKLKVQKILSSTKQVVSGVLYKIKAIIIESDCEKSNPKEPNLCGEKDGAESRTCNFEILDQPAPNGRTRNIFCLEDARKYSYLSKRDTLSGGVSEISADSPKVLELTYQGLEKIDSESTNGNKLKVQQVLSATQQVVSGTLYKIQAKIIESDCKKSDSKQSKLCGEKGGTQSRTCNFEIWDQPWLPNGRKIDISCEDDAKKYSYRAKRHVGALVALPLSQQKQLAMINQGLAFLDFEEEHTNKLAVQEILSAFKKVVSGTLYKFQVNIIETNCQVGDTIDPQFCGMKTDAQPRLCDIEIWVQPSLNRQITITCDDDSSKSHVFHVKNKMKPKKQPLLDMNDYHDRHLELFEDFMSKYNRAYTDQNEYNYRFKVFRKNLKLIQMLSMHEQGTAVYGVTKFADYTQKEFSKLLGYRPDLRNENEMPFENALIPNVDLPDSFDWREQNVVTEVKDQQQCGSCWAFSTTGNVEGQYAIKHKKLMEFSEQELVDCDKNDQGCNGGLMDNAYRAIEQLGGLETENDYPYDAEDEKCHFNKSLAAAQVVGAVNISTNETNMAKWLTANGPIAIAINANAMQFYLRGVSHPFKFMCNPKNLDHGVLIVGYGVENYPTLHRTLPYWIIKNSWGKSWGEQGYYRVYRGDGTCGVNQTPSSAIVA